LERICHIELTDFYFYGLFFIFCKSLELLLDRSCGLVDFKFVLSQLSGDIGHVGRAPCEDVSVVPEETGECEFLFGVEVNPDDDFLGCIGRPRQTFLPAGLRSKAVLVCLCSGTSRLVWSILAAWVRTGASEDRLMVAPSCYE
jgi:hypothetical protein